MPTFDVVTGDRELTAADVYPHIIGVVYKKRDAVKEVFPGQEYNLEVMSYARGFSASIVESVKRLIKNPVTGEKRITHNDLIRACIGIANWEGYKPGYSLDMVQDGKELAWKAWLELTAVYERVDFLEQYNF